MPELVVASFNVHWSRGPRGLGYPPFDLVDACRTLDADVLVLQECWVPDGGVADHDRVATGLGLDIAAAALLARTDVDPHPKVRSRADRPRSGVRRGGGSWALAVLTRLPIASATTTALPQLPLDPVNRALLTVEVEVGDRPFTVIGAHMAHLETGVAFHTRALRRALPSTDRPAALLGDMNMWAWCLDLMAPPGWRRTVRGKTFPAHRPHSQIDHLLVTPPVEVVEAEVLPDLGSDHRAIRARLRLP
jgi:endonuclease/exonuclease/phosphatase family metal-dependent hydrolase